MNRNIREIRRALDAVRDVLGADHPVLVRLTASVERLEGVKARIAKPKPPGRTKEERRAERNARAAEIRAAVMARADGRCEWCQREGFILEWHHIFGGGDRTAKEDATNTCGICFDCHRGWERGSLGALMPAANWAMRYEFSEALAAINRRIAKAEWSRPVRIEVAS